jgi:hypothetical protein
MVSKARKVTGDSGCKLIVVVEDSRGYEFSVHLDLIDPAGAALASTVVLARDAQLTNFDLHAEDIVSHGTIRIARKSSEEYGDCGLD